MPADIFLSPGPPAGSRTRGCDLKFVQDNQNRSERHVLRGLHYQLTSRRASWCAS